MSNQQTCQLLVRLGVQALHLDVLGVLHIQPQHPLQQCKSTHSRVNEPARQQALCHIGAHAPLMPTLDEDGANLKVIKRSF